MSSTYVLKLGQDVKPSSLQVSDQKEHWRPSNQTQFNQVAEIFVVVVRWVIDLVEEKILIYGCPESPSRTLENE